MGQEVSHPRRVNYIPESVITELRKSRPKRIEDFKPLNSELLLAPSYFEHFLERKDMVTTRQDALIKKIEKVERKTKMCYALANEAPSKIKPMNIIPLKVNDALGLLDALQLKINQLEKSSNMLKDCLMFYKKSFSQ
ncbi:hypothetical protein EIN_424270 [Entamoeba invadens IP1]|uniref:Uncharacterized protein n=1 Tax=Entamoeba invadens IP1 TaxID=370355 RepID=A0A0A1U5Z4_ENTIV|nr:hypothetical protein EIN_424270 [Entamoeba invadens IP1]ELP89745.1 hypothetical protein EIN_424270 [Entamoeba invadens IP1]|eukprot:XP_004256516.1 hypothetical protein EIN_424270 [Entamoeba invadens IP1]